MEHRGLPRRIQSRSLAGYRSLTHQADGTLQALCVVRYDERQDGEFQGVSGVRVLDGLSDGESSDEVSYDGVVGASGSSGSLVH